MTLLLLVVLIIAVAVLVYTLALQVITLVLSLVGAWEVRAYLRRRPMRQYSDVAGSPLSPGVSLIVPAHNEEPSIIGSIRSLLNADYCTYEVIVVDDGSTDGTLPAMQRAFDLVKGPPTATGPLTTQPVHATYISRMDPRLRVVAKENGGKADALNAALNHAQHPLVCAIDADTLLDRGALARMTWEFLARPHTVAVGGIVRVVNGSTFDGTRLVEARTPRGIVANVQIIEYLRAFLGARIGWSRFNILLIISGALGMFRRDAVLDVGGYDPGTVGEDAELVLQLHRRARDESRPYRITFLPDPICWTEVPSSIRQLSRQRDRWQRGLGQTLWIHRGMFLRKRYGLIGWVALPYFAVFEWWGPLIEVVGYLVVLVAVVTGLLNPPIAIWLFVLANLVGIVMSFIVIIIEQHAYRRYMHWRDLAWLCASAVLENLGYRQYLAVVRAKGMILMWRRSRTWGSMTRTGFGNGEAENAMGAVAKS